MLLVPITTSFWRFNFFLQGHPYWKLNFPITEQPRMPVLRQKKEVRPLVCASASSACLSGVQDSIAHTRDAPTALTELRWHPRFSGGCQRNDPPCPY